MKEHAKAGVLTGIPKRLLSLLTYMLHLATGEDEIKFQLTELVNG